MVTRGFGTKDGQSQNVDLSEDLAEVVPVVVCRNVSTVLMSARKGDDLWRTCVRCVIA